MTRKHEVFISFRGDIRLSLVDHLYGAFQRERIVAFKDDAMIKKGESLKPELLRAIEESLVYVVVFSKNYASSTWCLLELEMILQCVRVSQKCVFPVFYDVDPSEVRGQQVGNYVEAFAKHEERFKQNLDMVHKWRVALTQVANMSGYDMRHKPQYEEIKKMVKHILNILSHKSHPKDAVGMYSPIKKIERLLRLDSVVNVRVIGIYGIGGIGKSTLVTNLCGRISHQFDTCVFIDNVSKIYRRWGRIGLLQKFLDQILREEPLKIWNHSEAASLVQSRLYLVRALIILDNVDHGVQLEELAMVRECLGAGSRMIIVSKSKRILKEYGVDNVYKLPFLDDDDARQLFCRKAFKRDYVTSGYEQLVNNMLYCVNGLPLAIEVLGSFLCDRDISEWKSALARLRESPTSGIMNVLRLCFDGLKEMEKGIFLDVACFFVGLKEKDVKDILYAGGFDPDSLGVLIAKSLITSIAYDGSLEPTIGMPDLLQKLGKQIVQEGSRYASFNH